MVIKGSAAKRDGERLHPAADVEQEGMKKKGETEGRDFGVQGQKKRKTAQKGQKRKWENRERDKEGLNGDRKWKTGGVRVTTILVALSSVAWKHTLPEWKWD